MFASSTWCSQFICGLTPPFLNQNLFSVNLSHALLFPPLPFPVQHEEYGAGVALPSVRWDGEAAHSAPVPAQRMSAVCGGDAGAERLSSPGSPCGAHLTSLHAQRSLSTASTPTRTQDPWPPGAGLQNRYRRPFLNVCVCVEDLKEFRRKLDSCNQALSASEWGESEMLCKNAEMMMHYDVLIVVPLNIIQLYLFNSWFIHSF